MGLVQTGIKKYLMPTVKYILLDLELLLVRPAGGAHLVCVGPNASV